MCHSIICERSWHWRCEEGERGTCISSSCGAQRLAASGRDSAAWRRPALCGLHCSPSQREKGRLPLHTFYKTALEQFVVTLSLLICNIKEQKVFKWASSGCIGFFYLVIRPGEDMEVSRVKKVFLFHTASAGMWSLTRVIVRAVRDFTVTHLLWVLVFQWASAAVYRKGGRQTWLHCCLC